MDLTQTACEIDQVKVHLLLFPAHVGQAELQLPHTVSYPTTSTHPSLEAVAFGNTPGLLSLPERLARKKKG